MKRWLALALFAIGLALIGYGLLSEESDEEKIHALLVQLEDAVRVEGSSNVVLRKTRIDSEFEEIFEPDVRVSIPELTSAQQGRSHLAALAARSGAYFDSLDVDFSSIQIDAGDIGANVNAIGNVRVTRRGGRHERSEREVTFRFSKVDGDWRIESLRVAPEEQSR